MIKSQDSYHTPQRAKLHQIFYTLKVLFGATLLGSCAAFVTPDALPSIVAIISKGYTYYDPDAVINDPASRTTSSIVVVEPDPSCDGGKDLRDTACKSAINKYLENRFCGGFCNIYQSNLYINNPVFWDCVTTGRSCGGGLPTSFTGTNTLPPPIPTVPCIRRSATTVC